jgi:hypothetical protein
MKTFLKIIGCLVGIIASMPLLAAGEDGFTRDGYLGADAHRLPSAEGTTGLFLMTTAYTLDAGEARIGGTILYNDLNGADERITIPATFTLGITDRFELGAMIPTLEENISGTSNSGTGDGTVLLKYRFHSQSESFPEMALMGGMQLPTASETQFEEVEDFALIMGILGSFEVPFFQSVLGIHFEFKGVNIDPRSDTSIYQDDYNLFAFGLNLPVSDGGRLNFIAESRTVQDRTDPADNGTTILGGFRYMFKYFNAGFALMKTDSDSPTLSGSEREFVFTVGLGF